MKVWLEFMCEENHGWRYLRDDFFPQPHEVMHCAHGHEAVVHGRNMPAPVVETTIRPAEREIGRGPDRLGHDRQYYLYVSSVTGDWKAVTCETYELKDVMALAQTFVGMRVEKAQALWRKKRLGHESDRIDKLGIPEEPPTQNPSL